MKKSIIICGFSVLAFLSSADKIFARTESDKLALEIVTEEILNNGLFKPIEESQTNNNKVSKATRKEIKKALRVKNKRPVEGSRRHYGGYITGAGIVIFLLLILLL